MHADPIQLATIGVVAAFVPIIVVAQWLASTGRLGDAERRVGVGTFGPPIAAALSVGSVAIHLSIIGDHATHAAPSLDPVLFLCAIGAATAHPVAVDQSVVGFLPVGIGALVVTPLQAVWVLPAAWRTHRAAVVGLVVATVALVVTLAQLVMQPLLVGPTSAVGRVGVAGIAVALVECLIVVVVALALVGRPGAGVAAARLRAIDAFVAVGLVTVAVVSFTIAALGAGHGTH